MQNQPATLALDARESHPSTTGMHNVDLFSGKTIEWESKLAIHSYDAYDDNRWTDRAIGCGCRIAIPTPLCPKVVLFGIKDANHLRREYPLLPHRREKATRRLVDGLGLESVDLPCTDEGSYDSTCCQKAEARAEGQKNSAVSRDCNGRQWSRLMRLNRMHGSTRRCA